ncbi:MAG: serine/threonine protein kinase [Ectothiorhodospiraceae bacterium]|nr:serine/threonine protein kinase [Ectothiorhodospiraceae bacterium]MCH8503785.1 serine/threonine protein kinase [Ectothiorhodospiraceae bacterium]
MNDSDSDRTRPGGARKDADRTRVTGERDRERLPDDATRSARPPEDEVTHLAGEPRQEGGPGDQERTGGTASNWSRPELWGAPSEESPGVGSTVKQRFILEELLGQGGMGSVYKARDLRKEEAQDSQPYVALKLLSDEFRRHPDSLVALQREAKKAQVLAHPNIVTVHDFDRDGTRVYMTMEYLQGEPLDLVIRHRGVLGGLPQKEALHIIDRMSRGLAYAHQQGIVHSDFKPGNVFLTDDGNAKILDFGIARAARVGTAQGGDETRFDPATIGAITPAYASPEMLAGEVPEPADDVYALGCVAHELLTGRHPFLDEQGRKLPADEAVRRGMKPPLPKHLPKRVSRAVARSLAPRREDRFPDAGMFLQAVKPPARLGRAVIATVAVLALVVAVSWWMLIRESDLLVTLDDLPPALAESRELIERGNDHFETGDMPQAHRHYSLAWEQAADREDIGGRDRSRLRVLVDRRTDAVVDHYLREAQREDLDTFSLELLLISLESLERSELGTRGDRLRDTIEELDARLEE